MSNHMLLAKDNTIVKVSTLCSKNIRFTYTMNRITTNGVDLELSFYNRINIYGIG